MEEELEKKEDNIWIKVFNSAPSIKQYWDHQIFQLERRFNGFSSRNNLSRIEDKTYVINLNERKVRNTLVFIIYWKKFCCLLSSFWIENIPQEVLNKIKDKSITPNIFRIQCNHSIRCGIYCIVLFS